MVYLCFYSFGAHEGIQGNRILIECKHWVAVSKVPRKHVFGTDLNFFEGAFLLKGQCKLFQDLSNVFHEFNPGQKMANIPKF